MPKPARVSSQHRERLRVMESANFTPGLISETYRAWSTSEWDCRIHPRLNWTSWGAGNWIKTADKGPSVIGRLDDQNILASTKTQSMKYLLDSEPLSTLEIVLIDWGRQLLKQRLTKSRVSWSPGTSAYPDVFVWSCRGANQWRGHTHTLRNLLFSISGLLSNHVANAIRLNVQRVIKITYLDSLIATRLGISDVDRATFKQVISCIANIEWTANSFLSGGCTLDPSTWLTGVPMAWLPQNSARKPRHYNKPPRWALTAFLIFRGRQINEEIITRRGWVRNWKVMILYVGLRAKWRDQGTEWRWAQQPRRGRYNFLCEPVSVRVGGFIDIGYAWRNQPDQNKCKWFERSALVIR